MREIQATNAKTHLTQLLDDVGRGRADDVDHAIAGIKALRKRTGRITTDELLSARR